MQITNRDKYHLHSRAEFFCHGVNLEKSFDLDKVVNGIFKKQKIKKLTLDLPKWDLNQFKSKTVKQKRTIRKKYREQVAELNHTWILQMMETDCGLIEKMTLFWHGHFACRTRDNPHHTIDMNNLLRANALGSFKDLLFAVAKSEAMINYLHLKQNKKGKPNEDFARELCELFTLGRDIDYTEKDITEIARAFTGWTTDNYGKHIIIDRKHDNGSKTIFGKTGNFSGEDVLEMILNNSNCANYIAKKVYRFFVQEKENEAHIKELAVVLYGSNYNITSMMKYLFKADWFYQTHGKMIKSPIGLLVGFGKMFDLKYPSEKTVNKIQNYLGQVLFNPPNVAGWAGGRKWIDASRLALRLRLGSLILNKGYIADELSPELDAQINKKKKQTLVFNEQVDWECFWKKNKDIAIFDLLIRTNNEVLKSTYNKNDVASIIKLISTPDFQLL